MEEFPKWKSPQESATACWPSQKCSMGNAASPSAAPKSAAPSAAPKSAAPSAAPKSAAPKSAAPSAPAPKSSAATAAPRAAPPQKPITAWARLVSLVVLVGLAAGVLLVFSDVFKTGDDVLAMLGISSTLRYYLAYMGIGLFLVLYVLDFSYWPGRLGAILRRLGTIAVIALFIAAALVSQTSLPYVPLAVCLLTLPFAALFMGGTVFSNNDPADVARWLGAAFLLTSFATLVLWLAWFLGGIGGGGVRHWASKRQEFSELAGCNAVNEAGEYIMARRQTLKNGETTCLSAMLLWATPVITICVLLVLGAFLHFVGRALAGEGELASKALKTLGGVVFLSLVGLYSSVSVIGAGSGLATAGFAIYGVVLISTVVVLAAIIGVDSVTRQLLSHPWLVKMRSLGAETMNFINALMLFFGAIPFAIFLLLSFLNQSLRRLDHHIAIFRFSKVLQGEEAIKIRWLTAAANRQLEYLKTWEWSAVLNYVQTICLVMWALNYGASLTYVLLNALIAALITVHWGIVSVLFFSIGLGMFLIPVVPGTAVYLTGGVLLVPVCEAAWSGCRVGGACLAANVSTILNSSTASLANPGALDISPVDCAKTGGGSFWLAILWANLLVFLLKVVAHLVQMKLFGETLGKRASVRSQVQPNTHAMKAVRLILEKPGVNFGKACIMCGGPDWPTSVLCGMLHLSYVSTSLGLVPIFAFTIPTTLAGAFKTKTSESGLGGLDSLAMVVLLLMQMVFGLGLVYLTNRVVTTEGAALEAIPDDEEVKASDEAKAKTTAIRKQATRFSEQPSWARAALITATVLLAISAYGLMLVPATLFQPFSLTDCQRSLGAQAPHDFLPTLGASRYGVAALVLLLISIVLGKVFGMWESRATKAALEKAKKATPLATSPRAPRLHAVI